MAEKYGIELIIIAIPSADRKTIRDILEICKLTDCELKKVPAVYQLEDGNARIRDIRDVEV